jgi:hypothetical protein
MVKLYATTVVDEQFADCLTHKSAIKNQKETMLEMLNYTVFAVTSRVPVRARIYCRSNKIRGVRGSYFTCEL